MDCLFCAIVAGEIPSTTVYSDDKVVAFLDIAPQAPIHLVVVPRQHFANAAALGAEDEQLAGHLLSVAASLGREHSADSATDGFRINFNTGPAAGQSVEHVHAHVLAGRQFGWPPG